MGYLSGLYHTAAYPVCITAFCERQGPGAVEAADPGPQFPVLAGEGALGTRAAARPPDLRPADQQAGGTMEGQRGRHLPGPGEAGRRRGSQPGAPQVRHPGVLGRPCVVRAAEDPCGFAAFDG